MHHYRKNIGDYHRKAGRLSILAHGAYNLLIDACYDREQFPTLTQAIDWTWASSEAEIEAVQFLLKKFFRLENGVYVQKHIEEDLQNYHKNGEKKRTSALEREKIKRDAKNHKKPQTDHREPQTVIKKAQTVAKEPQTDHKKAPKPITNNQEPITNKNIKEIFVYWCSRMNKDKAKLTSKRKSCINSRLNDDYSVDQIKSAIDGCANSDHHMGQNDSGTLYDDLTLICRSGDYLEGFIDKNKKIPRKESKKNNSLHRSLIEDLHDHSWAPQQQPAPPLLETDEYECP